MPHLTMQSCSHLQKQKKTRLQPERACVLMPCKGCSKGLGICKAANIAQPHAMKGLYAAMQALKTCEQQLLELVITRDQH